MHKIKLSVDLDHIEQVNEVQKLFSQNYFKKKFSAKHVTSSTSG